MVQLKGTIMSVCEKKIINDNGSAGDMLVNTTIH